MPSSHLLPFPHPKHENVPYGWHVFMFGIYLTRQGEDILPVMSVGFIQYDEGGKPSLSCLLDLINATQDTPTPLLCSKHEMEGCLTHLQPLAHCFKQGRCARHPPSFETRDGRPRRTSRSLLEAVKGSQVRTHRN